jgi:hypothetical protein
VTQGAFVTLLVCVMIYGAVAGALILLSFQRIREHLAERPPRRGRGKHRD